LLAIKLFLKLFFIIGGVALVLYCLSYTYFYYQEKPVADAQLQSLPIALKHTRLLVVAPHCDDETLGCGGLIHDVIEAGGQVLVVVMTNGDGFTVAAEEQFHRIFLTNADYVNSGYTRQHETLQALHVLGMTKDQIVFLGYPDRGLKSLWMDYWNGSQSYQSRYTGSDHSPYSNSYQQNAPYVGQAVLGNLEQLMLTFQPNVILAPHPSDEHPDHAATWAFVAASFAKLSTNGILEGVKLYTYLIHRGDFPIPHGYKKEAFLSPPKPLYQTQLSRWLTYAISSNTESLKEESIKEYVSQLRVPIMSSLLYSFIRKNEIFEEAYIPSIVLKPLNLDLSSLDAWSNQEPIIVNPRGVSLIGALEHRGKIAVAKSYVQDTNIWLQFHIPDFSKKQNQYHVSIVTFSLQDGLMNRDKRTAYFSIANTDIPQDAISRYQDDVIIKIPITTTQLPNFFFIQAVTKDKFGAVIDHTIWQPVFLIKF
jgi:LmbE family N-acetylglucosaminyl deacetylase